MLPSYEQLLRPQHKVSPRGGSSRSISRSIAPPPGSLLPPLSQQASSPTNRRNLGLILPPTLVISQLAPRYFFSISQTQRNHALRPAVQVHRGGNGSRSRAATAWQVTAPAVPGRKSAISCLWVVVAVINNSCYVGFSDFSRTHKDKMTGISAFVVCHPHNCSVVTG